MVFLIPILNLIGQSTSFNGSYGNFFERNVGTSSSFSSANSSLSENLGLFSGLVNPSLFLESDNDIEIEISTFLLNPQNQFIITPSVRKRFKKSFFTINYANQSNNNIIDSRNFFNNAGNFQNLTFGSLKYNSQLFVGSYTQQVKNWSLGGNVKFFHENIGNIFIKNGFSSDFGANYKLKSTKLGFLARNLIGSHEFWKVNLSEMNEVIGQFNQNNGETIALREMGYDVYNPTLIFGLNQNLGSLDSVLETNLAIDLVNYLGNNPNDFISSKLLSSNVRLSLEMIVYNQFLIKISSMGLSKDLHTNQNSISYGFGLGFKNKSFIIDFGGFRQKWLQENYWSLGGSLFLALNK